MYLNKTLSIIKYFYICKRYLSYLNVFLQNENFSYHLLTFKESITYFTYLLTYFIYFLYLLLESILSGLRNLSDFNDLYALLTFIFTFMSYFFVLIILTLTARSIKHVVYKTAKMFYR